MHIGKTQNFIGGADTLTLFGVPLCEGKNGPRAMIQVSIQYSLVLVLI